ncbi:MAG TPA: hypothetical protein VHL34_06730 [Rhizomicrobium sp.]|nr:hypothetical protein [Rhizomicrobium sp.]
MVEPEYRSLHVLIVGGKAHHVRVLRTVLSLIGINEIVAEQEPSWAMRRLKTQFFDAVFCDETVDPIGDVPFVIAARREPDVLEHMVPIFLTCSAARLKQVNAARDSGVTDVLARPLSAQTIMRKLSLALLKPRSFIVAPDFFGPDRRSKGRPTYTGEDRRSRKTRKVKVAKATGPGTKSDYFV